MKKKLHQILENGRIRDGQFASSTGDLNGMFEVRPRLEHGWSGTVLRILASDGSEWQEEGLPGKPWEHVSVSTKTRTPTWEEDGLGQEHVFRGRRDGDSVSPSQERIRQLPSVLFASLADRRRSISLASVHLCRSSNRRCKMTLSRAIELVEHIYAWPDGAILALEKEALGIVLDIARRVQDGLKRDKVKNASMEEKNDDHG